MLNRKSLTLLTLLVAGFVFPCVVWSGGYTDLSAIELKSRMDSGENLLLINSLSDLEYNEGHIPGSINIPFHQLATSELLPEDKSTPLVTYCLGPKCIFYKKAADLLTDLGYINVITFKAGIPGWVKAGYPLETTKAMPKTKIPTIGVDDLNGRLGNVTIVDIRSESLYGMGWLPGSIKIPLGLLSAEYTTVPKDKPIVVVDHAGKQVLTAGRFLTTKGYSDVSRLQGGLMAWSQKGYPLDR